MAQVTLDEISATRRLKDAGFAPEQAEAVVRTVTLANSLTTQMIQDLAEVKAHISENMVTRSFLVETLGRYDLQNMVTKSHLAETLGRYDLQNMVTKSHLAETLGRYDLQNMVTKSHLAETLGRYDLQNMATKSDLASLRLEMSGSFARLYRNLLFACLGLAGVIISSVKFL